MICNYRIKASLYSNVIALEIGLEDLKPIYRPQLEDLVSALPCS